MIDDEARQDLAFIRAAIEEGHAYAARCGPDLLTWGIAVTIGHLGTYAVMRGWSTLPPGLLWAACIGLPWLYSLRRLPSRLRDPSPVYRAGAAVTALRMLWLGCGIFLTTLWLPKRARTDGRSRCARSRNAGVGPVKPNGVRRARGIRPMARPLCAARRQRRRVYAGRIRSFEP